MYSRFSGRGHRRKADSRCRYVNVAHREGKSLTVAFFTVSARRKREKAGENWFARAHFYPPELRTYRNSLGRLPARWASVDFAFEQTLTAVSLLSLLVFFISLFWKDLCFDFWFFFCCGFFPIELICFFFEYTEKMIIENWWANVILIISRKFDKKYTSYCVYAFAW